MKYNLNKNGEGYADPTACKAIRNVEKERKKAMKDYSPGKIKRSELEIILKLTGLPCTDCQFALKCNQGMANCQKHWKKWLEGEE